MVQPREAQKAAEVIKLSFRDTIENCLAGQPLHLSVGKDQSGSEKYMIFVQDAKSGKWAHVSEFQYKVATMLMLLRKD